MEILRSWITGITVAAFIVATASMLAPKNPTGKLVKLAGALILICAVIAPLKKFDVDFISPYFARYNLEFENLTENLFEENQKIQAFIIEEKMSAYILQRANDIGIDLNRVKVKAGISEEGYLYPEFAEIELGEGSTQGEQLKLSEIIERECAIPYTRQKFLSGRKGEVENA